MRKKLLLIGALAFLAALNAQARIGYTLEQCVALYGPEYEDFSGTAPGSSRIYGWKTKTIDVTATFLPGSSTVGCMQYDAKMNGEEDTYFITGDPAKDYWVFYKFFSKEVIADLLQKNAPAAVWKKTKGKEKDETDYRSSAATAVYFSHICEDEVNRNGQYDHPQLHIKTPEFVKWDDALTKEVEAEEKAKEVEEKKLATDKL